MYSTDIEEFFWKKTDEPVEPNTPIGYDLDEGNEVKFILFEDVYWRPNYENKNF